jgi:CRP/FNR family cyclic AMP-dependent transcriptional regulator
MSSEYLRAIPYLSTLTEAELQALTAHAILREVPSGTRILEQDAPVDSVYFVVKGIVHVRNKTGDREVLLARIGEGGFFGEINLFIGDTASASVYAMEKTTLASIPYSAFRTFMDSNPEAGYKIVSLVVAELAHRLKKTNERLANSLFWGASN